MFKSEPVFSAVQQLSRRSGTHRSTFDIEIYSEYLDLTRFQGSENQENQARFLGEKYSALKPDLIITVYPKCRRCRPHPTGRPENAPDRG